MPGMANVSNPRGTVTYQKGPKIEPGTKGVYETVASTSTALAFATKQLPLSSSSPEIDGNGFVSGCKSALLPAGHLDRRLQHASSYPLTDVHIPA